MSLIATSKYTWTESTMLDATPDLVFFQSHLLLYEAIEENIRPRTADN